MKDRKWLLIISLLALNVVEQAASSTSSSIPQMARSFPQQSEIQIEMVTTIVAIFVTIFVLVSGFASSKIGQKQTAIIGLIIASISSVIPAFSNNFSIIMMSRAALGIGIGLANPLAISLIGSFFEGDMLANLMGWRSAIAGIGSSLMTLGAGYLLKISWHASYLVYLLFIPTLIMFVLFVPSPEKYGISKQDDTFKEKVVTEKYAFVKVILLALIVFSLTSLSSVFMLKIATMFVQNGLGSPTDASTVLSATGFMQLIGGALFGVIYKFTHKIIFPLGLFLGGVGMFIIGQSTSYGFVFISSLITGTFTALAIPYIFLRITDLSSTKKAPLNNALILAGSNLGVFVGPYIGSVLGNRAAGAISGAGLAIITVSALVVLYMLIFERKKKVGV